MTNSLSKNLNLFKMLCGSKATRNVIFVTTMWDRVRTEVGQQREEDLKKQQWLPMVELGSMVARFERTSESAWNIIDRIVQERPADALRLQEEIVDLHLPLGKTEVGTLLYGTRQNYLAKQREAILRLLKEAEVQDNENLVHELIAKYDVVQRDIQYDFGEHLETRRRDILSRIRLLLGSRKAISVSSMCSAINTVLNYNGESSFHDCMRKVWSCIAYQYICTALRSVQIVVLFPYQPVLYSVQAEEIELEQRRKH